MQLDAVRDAIRLRQRLTIVTGEPAAITPHLWYALAEDLDQTTFTALILDSVGSEEALLGRILRDFGVISKNRPDDEHLASASKQELVNAVHRFLRGLRAINASAALIVNDAQDLPASALLQIAKLAGVEEEGEPLLHTVLVGPPEFYSRLLRSPELAELTARISVHCELETPPAPVEEPKVPWLQRRATVGAAIAVVAIACALAVGLTALLYARFAP